MIKRDDNSIELRKILAENIRNYRHRSKLSQEKLAELCGFHRTYVGSVERADRNVTLNTIAIFAQILGVTVPELLSRGAFKK